MLGAVHHFCADGDAQALCLSLDAFEIGTFWRQRKIGIAVIGSADGIERGSRIAHALRHDAVDREATGGIGGARSLGNAPARNFESDQPASRCRYPDRTATI